MSQEFYSLDEAAKKLGLTTQELNAMAQHREIRAFADRGTWRFKSDDIDELATRRGFVSNPNFRLSDPNMKTDLKGTPSDIFAEDRAKIQAELKGKPSKGDTGRVDLAALAGGDDETGSSSASSFVFGNKPAKGQADPGLAKPLSHDDESVVPIGRESVGGLSGDSRVRLDSASDRLPDMGVHLVDFDMKPISDPPSSRKLVPPPITPSSGSGRIKAAGGSGRIPPQAKKDSGRMKPPSKPGFSTSSEFELKPTSAGPNDSIFDFTTPSMDNIDLELAPGQEDLVDLGGTTQPPSQGGSMRAKLPAMDEESSTFELNLEPSSSEELAVMPLTPRPEGIKDTSSEFDLSLQVPEQSSSDFELQVDDSSGNMSALESSADTSSSSTARIPSDDVVVGEDSDFELALDDDAAIVDETGSEVVVIDEDDAGTDVMTGAAAAGSAALLAKRKKKGAAADDEEAVVEPYEDEEYESAGAPARPAEWGWVSLVHLPTALIMIFTGFLLFEMVRSIAGYETKSVITGKIFDLVKSITN